MASEPVDRKGVRRKKVNTMNGMGGSEVGSGGTYVKVLDGETLHGASGAVRGMDGHGVLVIGAAGAIGGAFGASVRPAREHNATPDVPGYCALGRPIRRRLERSPDGI